MRVLVIPDVHLKPQMFRQAAAFMRAGKAKRAVCLMDIPDDWDREYDIACYEETYDEAIRFAVEFPDTAWCYGNHDLSYFWHCPESGYSSVASETVQRKLLELRRKVPEDNPICYVQKIDHVLFSHGGVLNYFVEEYVPKSKYHDVDAVVKEINKLGLMIAYYRKLRGITQIQLAEYINVSRTHISNLEAPNMPTSISLDRLFDIADALEVPISCFFEFREK